MEPIRYFDSVEMLAPRCKGCGHPVNYQEAVYDERAQSLTCKFCKSPL